MKPKIYDSKLWLMNKIHTDNLSIDEIAKLANVSVETIYRFCRKHGVNTK